MKKLTLIMASMMLSFTISMSSCSDNKGGLAGAASATTENGANIRFEIIEQNGKYGYADEDGNTVIPCEFDEARYFSNEGLAAVCQNGKWGYINKSGDVVIPLKYDSSYDFTEGLAWVEQNGKYGYIDKSGKLVIPMVYDGVLFFDEGLAAVRQNGKWGYI
ncbi:MAG: WG repeat-containing protein, partial [Muribaculaceae bacterium]|nr:WG repeat-containing protein [Muribaculaceae bacterium]